MIRQTNQWVLFKNKSYCFYAISAFLAMISYGVSYIALTWIVLHYDGGGVKPVVILMCCFWVPSIFIGPFSGVIVDQIDRRKLFIFMSWSRGLLLLILGLIEWKSPSLKAIYIVSLIEGIISTPVLPTVAALVREIVPEEQLLIANSTIDTIYETGNVVGMALAGFAIACLSRAGALIATGLLFFIATLFSYGITTPYATKIIGSKISFKLFWIDFREGLRYIVHTSKIKVVYSLQLLTLVSYMVIPVLTAPFARQYLHANVKQFGYLEALLSVGIVLGNFATPALVRGIGLLKNMVFYNIILGVCFYFFAGTRHLYIAYTLNFLIGLGFASWSLIMTRAQELTDLDYQGRVLSSFNALSSVGMLLVYAALYFEGTAISLAHLYYVQVGFAVVSIFLLLKYHQLFK